MFKIKIQFKDSWEFAIIYFEFDLLLEKMHLCFGIPVEFSGIPKWQLQTCVAACNACILTTCSLAYPCQSWITSLSLDTCICIISLALYLFVYMLPNGIYMWTFDGPDFDQNTKHYLEKKFYAIWMWICEQEESLMSQRRNPRIVRAKSKRKMV